MKTAITVTALLLAAALLAAQAKESAPAKPSMKLVPSVEGPDLFRAHCAACHGSDARGKGPAASEL